MGETGTANAALPLPGDASGIRAEPSRAEPSHAIAALRPEAELLMRTAGGPAQDARIAELLRGPLDWGVFTLLATQQRAARVAWRRIERIAADRVPGEPRAALQKLAMVAEFEHVVLEQQLRRAVGLLEAAGIRVLLLKGAALAVAVYPRFADRPMADVDLLVDPAEAVRAQAILLDNGWKTSSDAPRDGFYTGHQHLPPLVDAQGARSGLEIHGELIAENHPFGLHGEGFWARAEAVRLGPHEVWVPSTTDALLHLCVHFAWMHMAGSGAWRAWLDLEAITTRRTVDWGRFVAEAREAKATTSCFWTLRLARDLAGVAIPGEVLSALRPPYPESVLRRLERHLVAGLLPIAGVCPSARLARAMWSAAFRPGWSGHGAKRPWDRNEVSIATFQTEAPERGLAKVRVHLRALPAWLRYLRIVLLSSPSAPASPR